MTGGEIAQIITSIATLLGVAGTIYIGVRNSNKIDVIHEATNSMKDELVTVTKSASRAEGNLEGRAELKREQKPR